MLEAIQFCPVCEGADSVVVETTGAMMHSGESTVAPTTFTFRRCGDCGHVFLNPRLGQAHLGAFYTDAYLPYRGSLAWGRYAGRVASDQKAVDRRRVVRVLQRLARQGGRLDSGREAWRVLDVGCGKPTFLEALAGRGNLECTGVDFSDSGWRDEAARFRALRLITGSAQSVSPELRPQIITMWHYLEHDYAPADTLSHLASVVDSGTGLIIEVPDFDCDSRRRFGPCWAGYHTPRHVSLFTVGSLSRLLNRTGWRVVSMEQRGTLDPYVLVWMSEMERRGIDWTASMEPYFWGYVRGWLDYRLRCGLCTPWGRGFLTAVAERC